MRSSWSSRPATHDRLAEPTDGRNTAARWLVNALDAVLKDPAQAVMGSVDTPRPSGTDWRPRPAPRRRHDLRCAP